MTITIIFKNGEVEIRRDIISLFQEGHKGIRFNTRHGFYYVYNFKDIIKFEVEL